MKKNRTRFLSFLLSLVMIVTLVPPAAASQLYEGTDNGVPIEESDGVVPSETPEDGTLPETTPDGTPPVSPEDNAPAEIPEDNTMSENPENSEPPIPPEYNVPFVPNTQPGIPGDVGGDPWNYALEPRTAPSIPGYSLVTDGSQLQAGSNYLIVAQGEHGMYALYPWNRDGTPGNLPAAGYYGTHIAKLSVEDNIVTATTTTAPSQSLSENLNREDLHIAIAPSVSGYTLASAAIQNVSLSLRGTAWCDSNYGGFSITFDAFGAVAIASLTENASDSRALVMSESNGAYEFVNSANGTHFGTDFWGPMNNGSKPAGAPIYIYVEEAPAEFGTNLSQMFINDDSTHNSWVFTGGRTAQGSYQDIGGARSYAGHFEEYIRYSLKTGTDTGSPLLQRHVINVAYEGQSLADVAASFESRIAALNPRAVSYLMESGESVSEYFNENLKILIDSSLALRSGTGMIVIQTLTQEDKLAVDAVLEGLSNEQRPYVKSVLFSLSEGAATARGHLEMARQLAEAVTGESLQDSRWPYKHTSNGTPLGTIPSGFPYKEAVTAEHDGYDIPKTTAVSELASGTSDSLTWLFMGDSITHGAIWTDGFDSLPQLFEKFVKDDLGRMQDIVINTGSSGATAGTTLGDLDRRLNTYSPDVVVLMLGTNDAKSNVGEDVFKRNLVTILDAISAKGAIPVLRTPPPRKDQPANLPNYVQCVREVAAQTGVILVDQYQEWTSLSNWESVFRKDNIHPDEAGHVWMAHQLIYELGLWREGSAICSLEYVVKENAAAPDGYADPPAQPPADFQQPPDVLSGTGSAGPMEGDDTNSYFRIPAMVTLSNGWLVAASDIRWPNTNDSPNNLDTIVSVSKDGGATWDWEAVNYFADFAPSRGPNYYSADGNKVWPSVTNSASFIDPALVVDGSGKLWMLVDLQPPNVNLNQKAQKAGSGFDESGYLMVGYIPESQYDAVVNTNVGLTADSSAQLAQDHYLYRVDINGSDDITFKTAWKNGETVTLRPIFHRDGGALTGYYVDAFFDLWYDYGGNEGLQPVWCKQKQAVFETVQRPDYYVQANLFYIQSDWKAFSVTYLMLRSAEVINDELVWSDPVLVNNGIKGAERFLGVCPGRGITVALDGNSERIIFPVYDNVTSVERASTIYSDDGGATWTRGMRVPELGITSKASESQIVELPDGTLRMYSRNNKNQISYADSIDKGITWGASSFDTNLTYCGDCMVSFINLEGSLLAPDGTRYDNLILASYPKGAAYRSNGVIRIGSVGADNVVTWLNDDAIRYQDRFNYSCLTQLREEDNPNQAADCFAVLYEKDDVDLSGRGVMAMKFYKLTTADLLGDEWSFIPEGVDVEPFVMNLAADGLVEVKGYKLLDMVRNETKIITAECTAPVMARSAGPVVIWSSSNVNVVSADDGVITANGAGIAKITVTASNGNLTRRATVEVVVQETADEISTLPEKYGVDQVTEREVPASTVYHMVAGGVLANGDECLIYSENGTRLLYGHPDRTDQNNISGYSTNSEKTEINGKTGGGAIEQNLKWTLVAAGDGYAFRNVATGKYITTTVSTHSSGQLAVSDDPVSFQIIHQGNGVYNIKCGEQYLAFAGKWVMQAAPAALRLYRMVTGTIYATHADGLRALLQDMEIAENLYADVLALEGEYAGQSEAREAQDAIDAATRELYANLRAGESINVPTSRPTMRENDLYQVQVLCLRHRSGDEDCTDHWWSTPAPNWVWVDDFAVGEIEKNTEYQPETYPWRCPVTPRGTLAYYLGKLNEKSAGHTLVTKELPVAYYYYNSDSGAWEFIKNKTANPNCTVGDKNVYSLTIEANCDPAQAQDWLTSMEDTGYDRFIQQPAQLTEVADRKYLILAQSGAAGDTGVYALYLNPNSGAPGSAVDTVTAGPCVARLAREDGDIVGYIPGTNEKLSLDQLLLTVTSDGGGKFYIGNGSLYLNLNTRVADTQNALTVESRANTGGAYKISAGSRVLTLFVYGQNSSKDRWHTEFWGPNADQGQFGELGSSYVYFYRPYEADGRTVTAFSSDGTPITAVNETLTIPGGGYIKLDDVISFTVPRAVMSVTVLEKYAYTLELDANGGFSAPRCTITMEDGSTSSGVTRSGAAGSGVFFARTRENAVYFAGQGDIRDFSSRNIETPPWLNAIGDRILRSAYIGQGITGVGSNAFKGAVLTSVTLPDGLKSIGNNAFEATRIRSVTIPATVVSIGSSAFRGCMELTEVYLPASVASIGSGAFASCPRLRTVTIAGDVASIPSNAFQALSGHGPLNLVIHGSVPAGAWAGYEGMGSFLHQNAAIVYLSAVPGAELTESAGSDAYFAVVPRDVVLPALQSGILPVLPARNGEEFTGWQAGETGEIVSAPVNLLGAPGMGAADEARTGAAKYPGGTVFVPVWGSDPVVPETVTVTFTVDGVILTTVTVNSGESLGEQMPADPALDGFTFIGWEDAQGRPFGADTPVEGDTQLSAVWQKDEEPGVPGEATVTFIVNDAVLTTVTVNEGECLGRKMPADPIREGYIFTGWQDEQGNRFTAGTAVRAGMVVTAVWQKEEAGTVTVYFNPNGGVLSGASSFTLKEGDYLALSDIPGATRTGYRLNGWFTEDGVSFQGAQVFSSMTLTAGWTLNETSGGTVPPSSFPADTFVPPVFTTTPKEPVEEERIEEIEDSEVPAAAASWLKTPENIEAAVAALPHLDVPKAAWYAPSVAYVYSNGLMKGVSDTAFSPDATLNRGMMAQIIYNLARQPDSSVNTLFSDLDGRYYAEAVAWGASRGILKGYSDTEFGGERDLTREQMAVMLYRYAVVLNLVGNVNHTVLDSFSDRGTISSWAKEALSWAVQNGLMQGRGSGVLAPQANITRAEAAAILERYGKAFFS